MNTDFTVEADQLKVSEFRFRLSPALWNQYRGPDLDWKCAPFHSQSLAAIPQAPGVYAFCVRPSIGGNLCGSYLFYVGRTERSLRTRCREYLADAKADRGRPKVQAMMRHFRQTNHLFFCFAVVPDGDSASIEDSLLEATLPPACSQFPASVRPAVNAF